MKITKQTVKDIGKPERETWVWDSTMPGFGLRVWPSGRAVYVLRYRTDTRTQRKITIGDARAMHPDEARDRARLAIVAARDGSDPQQDRKRKAQSETIADLCKAYLEYQKAHLRPNSYLGLDQAFKHHILPAFGTTKCVELTADLVIKWHGRAVKRFAANKAVRHLSAALTWAVDVMQWLPRNPIKKFRYYPEAKRQMVLTPEQMRALIAAMDAEPSPRWAAPYLCKLLLITGLRAREWACAEWTQYNDAACTLHLPELKSKTGERTVQLGEEARIILRQIRSHPFAHDQWIFPNNDRKGPMKNPYSYWYDVIKRADLPRLRLHDLRHTFASYSLMSGATIKEVSQMLGHKQINTTSRYLGVFDKAVQKAQNRAAQTILNVAMTGELPGEDQAVGPKLAVAR